MRYLFAITGLILISACGSLRPRYHSVAPGESLEEVAKFYKVPVASLKKYNRAAVAAGLRSGSRLYIPFEEGTYWSGNYSADTAQKYSELPSDMAFSWPVSGYVSSPFGYRRGHFHEGIDIPAPKGTPVRAARSGHVIYSGNGISGYGNLVILQHPAGYSTVYAHLSKIDVKKGQFVSRGNRLGAVGRTGHATSNHLHFEIREDRKAKNPIYFLPGQLASNVAARLPQR